MTDHRVDAVTGYSHARLPVDPWARPMAYACHRCGAWAVDTDLHTAHHNRQAGGLLPHQLFALADNVRGTFPPPNMAQDVSSYVRNLAVHRLADALAELADAAGKP